MNSAHSCRFMFSNASTVMLCVVIVAIVLPLANSEPAEIKELGPGEKNVFERNLVTDNVAWNDIVINRNAYSILQQHHKNFSGDVLAYVTPWNNHGYDIAKTFASKFTLVSPVWLQVKPQGGSYVITGTHDIDKGWINDVRNKEAKLLPRLLFDQWTLDGVLELSNSQTKISTLGDILKRLANENNFDGYVLELWSQNSYMDSLADALVRIVRGLYRSLKVADLSLILVIPPLVYDEGGREMFTRAHFEKLRDHVNAFSLMTYDFSNVQRPGPNSPIKWVRECVETLEPSKSRYRAKILIGLNFYGYDYTSRGGGAIIGHQFAETLVKYKPKIVWHEESAEHYIKIRGDEGNHMIFFPTLKAISMRLELAKELGCGVAIWEVGQGMDYFYDLL